MQQVIVRLPVAEAANARVQRCTQDVRRYVILLCLQQRQLEFSRLPSCVYVELSRRRTNRATLLRRWMFHSRPQLTMHSMRKNFGLRRCDSEIHHADYHCHAHTLAPLRLQGTGVGITDSALNWRTPPKNIHSQITSSGRMPSYQCQLVTFPLLP